MKNLNIFNLEEIILSNLKVLDFLRVHHKSIYDDWQKTVLLNSKAIKTKFYITFLNYILVNNLNIDLESILGYKLIVEVFDVGLIKNFDYNISDICEFMYNNDFDKYRSISIYRNKESLKITAWR